jgi:uncharacterized protein (TIGR02466 family)
MSVIKHEWWATPVWEIQTGFDSEFNEELLVEISKCVPPTNPHSFNIWDYKTPRISELKNKILTCVTDNVSPYLPQYSRFNPQLSRGWVNRQYPQQSLALHDHGASLLACTYYIKSENNSGDLLLVDPRGTCSNWESVRDGNVVGVKYKRVTPKEGKLVFFPAYVIHMVETNNSKSTRISLSTNI